MSCAPELCASCGEFRFGVVRDLCPECRESGPPEAKFCHKVPAECSTCKKCERTAR